MTLPVPVSSHIAAFWDAFCAAEGKDGGARFYEAFHFDDNESSANELAELVLTGVKRATASLLWSFESAGRSPPSPGALSVVTCWGGDTPVCVIETTSVEVVPFDQVGTAFAATEGEGDGSLAYWQSVHRDYFGRECERLGREPIPDMPVVCERFRVVYRARK